MILGVASGLDWERVPGSRSRICWLRIHPALQPFERSLCSLRYDKSRMRSELREGNV